MVRLPSFGVRRDRQRTWRGHSHHRDASRRMLLEALEDRRLLAADFGDAPAPYPTLLADDGARHLLGELSPHLGPVVADLEEDGFPDVEALGDDTNQEDDEDALGLGGDVLVPGRNTRLFVQQGQVGGILNAWIDFNRDGDWMDEGEQIANNLEIGNQGFFQAIDFTVPASAVSGVTYGRFRISTSLDLGPTGEAPDGEVEDHRFVISGLDFGDAPDSYGTTLESDGARHALVRNTGGLGSATFALGTLVDGESDGIPTATADGDDNNNEDDEDGISGLDSPLLQGTNREIGISLTIPESITTATLSAWIDFNQDGDFEDEGENVLFEFVDASTSSAVLAIPADAVSGTTLARFRLTTETAIGPTGFASDGEVEDYLVTIGEAACSLVVTTTEDSLIPGTLRSAILCANATPNIDRDGDSFADPDPITFAIPGAGPHTIQPLSDLPVITDALHLDGSSQPGFTGVPLIEVDGSLAGSGPSGSGATALVFQGNVGGSVVESLVINRFTGRAIEINGSLGGYTITGNYIGTDVTGTVAAPNGGPDLSGAIWIDGNSNGHLITQNLISGNHNIGMLIGSTGNTIVGNRIGTDASGTVDVGNGASGMTLLGFGNVVRDNLISGNDDNGLVIEGGDNLVAGNRIGTDVTGMVNLGNSSRGILINGSGNTIGGVTAPDLNLISGNGADGVSIGDAGNRVVGNKIGTDITGNAALANINGVSIFSGSANVVEQNLVSGNEDYGIRIGDEANGNFVFANIIGANEAGTAAVANFNGILIRSSNNIIGVDSSAPDAGNLISGNIAGGVVLSGSATSNRLASNRIGTDITGDVALGNGSFGVFLADDSANNTIGGTTPQLGNQISGNNGGGIGMQGTGVTGNIVQGNRIGSNAAGTAKLGNGGTGVLVIGTDNVIGGPNESAGNLIADNINGVELVRSNNLVQNNWIGTDVTGTIDLGNRGPGVFVNDGRGNQIIENVIAFNGIFGGGTGVAMLSRADGNPILSNSIYANEGLGIDLGDNGVTPNDPGDGDTGANNQQNFPILTSAIVSDSSSIVTGTLNSLPNASFVVQFFSNDVVDPSGFGEGKTFIAQTQVTTDAAGNAAFEFDTDLLLTAGSFVTATATLIQEQSFVDTSEFSAPVQVSAVGPLLVATKRDTLVFDDDGDGKADPDDVIGYTIRIDNDGDFVATEVGFEDPIDENTTLLPASITVTPLAVDDQYTAMTGTTLEISPTIGLLRNDFDIDGSAPGTNEDLSIVLSSIARVGGEVAGSLEVDVDGSFTYVPPVDQTGSEVFSYNIVDADGLSAVTTGFVTFQVVGEAIDDVTPTSESEFAENPMPVTATSESELTAEQTAMLFFEIPVIPPGKGLMIEFQTRVNTELSDEVSVISNQGTLRGDMISPLLTDDPDTPEVGDATLTLVDVPSVPIADLSLTKSLGTPSLERTLSPEIGENLSFLIEVRNDGPDVATGVEVTDKLPDGLNFVAASPSVGLYDNGSGVWTIGQINPGTAVTLELVAQLVTEQSVVNTAEVTASDQFDPDSTPGNGVAEEDDQDSVVVGQCLTGGPLTVGVNRFSYSCVTPGGFAKLLVGTEFGSTFIHRWGVTVDIANPVQVAIGVGNIDGVAEMLVHLTENQLAHDLIFQAYEMVPEAKVSNTLRFTDDDDDRLDVNLDGDVTALDALLIINQLTRDASTPPEGEIAAASAALSTVNYDANRDGKISALDALLVINHLSRSGLDAEPEAERPEVVDAVMTDWMNGSAVEDDERDDDFLTLFADEAAPVA